MMMRVGASGSACAYECASASASACSCAVKVTVAPLQKPTSLHGKIHAQ
jgi:hypothetical protein